MVFTPLCRLLLILGLVLLYCGFLGLSLATGAVAAVIFCVCFDAEEVMEALCALHQAYLPRTIVVTNLIPMEVLQSPTQI